MTIIKSIEARFNGVTFPISGTNFYARINGSSITGIIYIHEVGENWLDNLDIRIMATRLNDINRLAEIINTIPYLVVEYEDLHGYIDLDGVLYDCNTDYVHIDKRYVKEIKGGEYKIDRTISKEFPERKGD